MFLTLRCSAFRDNALFCQYFEGSKYCVEILLLIDTSQFTRQCAPVFCDILHMPIR